MLGIDWGAKRIGIAVSDQDGNFVFLRRAAPAAESLGSAASCIAEIAKSEGATGIVVGLPLRLDGTDSDTTKRVREFATELASATDIPIILFDESLTSFEAAERTKDKSLLDSESARVLLENFIAACRRKRVFNY